MHDTHCSWLRLFKDLEEVKAAVTGSLSLHYVWLGRLTNWQRQRHGILCMYWPLAVGYTGPTDCGTICFSGCRCLTPVHVKIEDIGFTPWSWLADVWGLQTESGTADCWVLTVDRHWPAAAAAAPIFMPYFNIARTTGFDIIRKFQCFISFKWQKVEKIIKLFD